jgi:hypothetical protein
MRNPADKNTADLLPNHDLAGERPATPSKGKQRLDAMRERRGLKGLTANLPTALVDEFHAKRKERGQTVNEAIEKLLRTQYLRKR